MLTIIYFLLYNLLVYPLIFFISHIIAIFNHKVRKGISGRYQTIREVNDFIGDTKSQTDNIFLIHCASMGEFEHIKPFVRALKQRLPDSKIVVMFFSPSGYENVKSAPGVDLFIYTPFDWWLPVWRLFKTLNPRALIIAKYDVWPNQIWMARFLGVPRFLINATLYQNSSRIKIPLRWFLQTIYSAFNRILTISEADKSLYTRLARKGRIVVVGDTKYDQVVFRSEESRKRNVLPKGFCDGKTVFVAGSTWPEDEVHLIPALKAIARKKHDLQIIICPHEPTPPHIAELKEHLHPLNVRLYSELATSSKPSNEIFVIVIDKIGLLANLYSVADVAYVGGSFKQNIHNVLEPAAYGIPVLFGPINQNSHEAQLLKQTGGGIEVNGEENIKSHLEKIFSEEQYRNALGQAAKALVNDKLGATGRTVEQVLKYFDKSNYKLED